MVEGLESCLYVYHEEFHTYNEGLHQCEILGGYPYEFPNWKKQMRDTLHDFLISKGGRRII